MTNFVGIDGAEPIEPFFLTRREAAQALRIGVTQLDGLIASGDIPAVHIGRSVRIPTAGLREYAERLTRKEAS